VATLIFSSVLQDDGLPPQVLSGSISLAGDRLLVLSSRFQGLEDTVSSYDSGQLGWTSSLLGSLAESDPQTAAATLKGDSKLQEACLSEFDRRLERYFSSLRKDSDNFFSKLHLVYKTKYSIKDIVTGVVDALDFNLFIPVGTYISNKKNMQVRGESVQTLGSFYFHGVLYPDTSWGTNFLGRISLHLSNVPTSNAPSEGRPDYELGDFYELQTDRSMDQPIVTELGINIKEFYTWLAVKRSVFMKKSSGRLPQDATVSNTVDLYKSTVVRLYREMLNLIKVQSDSLNYASFIQYILLGAKSVQFTDPVTLPKIDPSVPIFPVCHVAYSPLTKDNTPEGLKAELDKVLDAYRSDSSVAPEEVEALIEYASALIYRLNDTEKILSSYRAHLVEILTQLEFFSEELHVHDISIHRVVDAFVSLFEVCELLTERLVPVVSTQSSRLQMLFGPTSKRVTGSVRDYVSYWKDSVLVPLQPETKITLASSPAILWARFSELSIESLTMLQRKIRGI